MFFNPFALPPSSLLTRQEYIKTHTLHYTQKEEATPSMEFLWSFGGRPTLGIRRQSDQVCVVGGGGGVMDGCRQVDG